MAEADVPPAGAAGGAFKPNASSTHGRKHGKHTAYHKNWTFRREGAVWSGDVPVAPNFLPLATELSKWMRNQGPLRVLMRPPAAFPIKYTNPYLFDASALSIVYSSVINDCAAVVDSTTELEPIDAEVQRIRLSTEHLLYAVRACEALTKQLLYCTAIPEAYYRRASMAALLATDCVECRGDKERRHRISLLGSLAHRYHLCHMYEQCLGVHMRLTAKRRDSEAAHSGISEMQFDGAEASRSRLKVDVGRVGDDFLHMLVHLAQIEAEMLDEARRSIAEIQRSLRIDLSEELGDRPA